MDSYDNLILLCSKDHKRVDDQVGHYTADRLRQIKLSHEQWIKSLVISRHGSQVSKEEADQARAARSQWINERTQRLRRGANEEKMRLHYLDDWREGVTTSAVITWQDERGHPHERTVTDVREALELLRKIEADWDLREITCELR